MNMERGTSAAPTQITAKARGVRTETKVSQGAIRKDKGQKVPSLPRSSDCSNTSEAEIGNVLWKAVRRKRISSADAEISLRRFTELGIEMVPTSGLIERSLQIAISCDRSFYDSLYVALALATRTDLVTADERLVNALGSRFPVRWLGAF
jgi:predicted nucleic acid-binding protein